MKLKKYKTEIWDGYRDSQHRRQGEFKQFCCSGKGRIYAYAYYKNNLLDSEIIKYER